MPTEAASALPVLLTREQIARRVREMAAEITRDYAGQSIIFVGVLKGATVFLSDLARQVALDCTFDFLAVSSYADSTRPQGMVRLIKDIDIPILDRHVLLVEDILDTGRTLAYLQEMLLARKPRSLRLAALLDKPARRLAPVQGDYVGFQIPDRFVVGYGLDFAERYRNLPDVCLLPEEAAGR